MPIYFLLLLRIPKKVKSRLEKIQRKDSLVLNLSKNGVFTTNSLYDILMEGRMVQFPRKMIWNSCIPTKFSFFFFLFV